MPVIFGRIRRLNLDALANCHLNPYKLADCIGHEYRVGFNQLVVHIPHAVTRCFFIPGYKVAHIKTCPGQVKLHLGIILRKRFFNTLFAQLLEAAPGEALRLKQYAVVSICPDAVNVSNKQTVCQCYFQLVVTVFIRPAG